MVYVVSWLVDEICLETRLLQNAVAVQWNKICRVVLN